MPERKQQSSGANQFRFFKQPGSGFYSVRLMVAGRRRRFSTGEVSLKKARSKAAAIMADIRSRGFEAATALHARRRDVIPSDPTVAEFCVLSEMSLRTLDSPPSMATSGRYARSLERICEVAKVTRIRKLDAAAIERFKDAYFRAASPEFPKANGKGKGPNRSAGRLRDDSSVRTTLNGILRNAAALFSKRLLTAYELRGLDLRNPFEGSRIRRVAIKAHTPFPRELIERIWRDAPLLRDGNPEAPAPDPKAKRHSTETVDFRIPRPDAFLILLLEIGLGLRRNEADKAEWSWVVECPDGRRLLEVRASDGFTPKSKQSRVIPIDPAVWTAVVALREDTRFIVPAPTRKPSGKAKVKKLKKVKSAVYRCEEAHRVLVAWLRGMGVKDPKPCHALRKEFGSYVATHFSLFHAQKILGHSSPAVTSSYYASLTELPLLLPSQMGIVQHERKEGHQQVPEEKI